MNHTERRCKNCNAIIPSGERVCPNCGRLSIDNESSRIDFSQPQQIKPEKPDVGTEKVTTSSTEPKESIKSDVAEKPPSEEAKPDSFYAVTPGKPSPGEQPPSTTGGSSSDSGVRSGCCSPKVIMFIIVGWLLTVISFL